MKVAFVESYETRLCAVSVMSCSGEVSAVVDHFREAPEMVGESGTVKDS